APASDGAGVNRNLGALGINSDYKMEVGIDGPNVYVSQNLTIDLSITSLSVTRSGRPVDKLILDSYALTVKSDGGLEFARQGEPRESNSIQALDIGGAWGDFVNFFNHINDVVRGISAWAQNVQHTFGVPVNLNEIRQFIFPGGQTFAFKQPSFSKNGD